MEKLANHQRRKASLNSNMQAYGCFTTSTNARQARRVSIFQTTDYTQQKSLVHKEPSVARNYQCCKAL